MGKFEIKGQLRILDKTGDIKTIWDAEDEVEVRFARDQFNEFVNNKGYNAFAVKKDGEKGKKITEFDPKAGRIILVPPIVGG